jgi:ADP-ribosylglycohydrolase
MISKVTFKVEAVGPDLFGTPRFAMYVVAKAEELRNAIETAVSGGDSDALVEVLPAMLRGAKLQVPARLFVAVEQIVEE